MTVTGLKQVGRVGVVFTSFVIGGYVGHYLTILKIKEMLDDQEFKRKAIDELIERWEK